MNRKKQWTMLISTVLMSTILIAGCGNTKQTEPNGLEQGDVITKQTVSSDEQSPFVPPQTDAGPEMMHPDPTKKETEGAASNKVTAPTSKPEKPTFVPPVVQDPEKTEATTVPDSDTTVETTEPKPTVPAGEETETPTFVPPVVQDPEQTEATTVPDSDTTVETTEPKPTVPAEEKPKEPEAETASTQGSTTHSQPSEDEPSLPLCTGELDEGTDTSGYYGEFF